MDETLLQTIGQYLALGYSTTQIVEALRSEEVKDPESKVREFYDAWQQLESMVDRNKTDLLNWHVYMRHTLLQKAIQDNTVPGLRLALNVLDSMANVQGVAAQQMVAEVPLEINLVPKPLDTEDTE